MHTACTSTDDGHGLDPLFTTHDGSSVTLKGCGIQNTDHRSENREAGSAIVVALTRFRHLPTSFRDRSSYRRSGVTCCYQSDAFYETYT